MYWSGAAARLISKKVERARWRQIGKVYGRQEIRRSIARKHRQSQSAAPRLRGRGTRDGRCRTRSRRGAQEHGTLARLAGSEGSRSDRNRSDRRQCRGKEQAQEAPFNVRLAVLAFAVRSRSANP